ncbi:prenyltransferase/squalene oxidase repeat-containing protein [Paenibacillus harenae]|uniref:Sporulenol synthase n=1 Tax=Paenibacillus harenae TaxID=306543 RepID=A0ABT9TZR0_PAEHA|nr:prenyltransferase/squalene oxidase repeat-containing protein [Paenibacillus harenae]MDQ0111674.1 sporulenol synthase [Paenibacillus harenae]
MDTNPLLQKIELLSGELLRLQSPDGAWRFCFDDGVKTDSYMIILLRMLNRSDEPFIRSLAIRIASEQQPDGSWKLYHDEQGGNLDATAEACYALLYSGFYSPIDAPMVNAKKYIRSRGGLAEVKSLLTQVMLSASGQAEWPNALRVPLPFLFGENPLFDLFSLSGHARVHLVPTAIMANKHFARRAPNAPDLSDWFMDGNLAFKNDPAIFAALSVLFDTVAHTGLFTEDSNEAWRNAEQFMLDRLEPNGTLLTFSTATMLMIMALLALGYDDRSPLINRLLAGIRSLLCRDRPHIQVASAEVWDTAMLSYALREAGLPPSSFALRNAAAYLKARQQTKLADWAIRNPDTPPGGWGFSDVNTLYPDVDDSTASLRSLLPYVSESDSAPALNIEDSQAAWQRGLNWVLSMRNDDGGWPAFERQGSTIPPSFLNFEGAADIAVDPSTVDLTARTLYFLGKELQMTSSVSWLEDSVRYVLSQQQKDGSWYGRWGIAYIHGTGAALQGLTAIGVADDHPAVRKATAWLLGIQNPDGGWGESCLSDEVKHYVPLRASTPSQTAWALDGLIAVSPKPTPAIERGISALLQSLDRRDWTYTYPTGAGLPGSIYVHYASNNYIWPLLTLTSYVNKYGDN